VRVRCFAETGTTEGVTLLLEEVHVAGPDKLDGLGLTPREAEGLFWIAGGKSNPEIAIIPANPTGTVKKQVGRILEKLALESRLATALSSNVTIMVTLCRKLSGFIVSRCFDSDHPTSHESYARNRLPD